MGVDANTEQMILPPGLGISSHLVATLFSSLVRASTISVPCRLLSSIQLGPKAIPGQDVFT